LFPTPDNTHANVLEEPDVPVPTPQAVTVKLNGHTNVPGRSKQLKLIVPLDAVAVKVQLPVADPPDQATILAALQLPVIPAGHPVVDLMQPVFVKVPVAATLNCALTVQNAFSASCPASVNSKGDHDVTTGGVSVQEPADKVKAQEKPNQAPKISSIVTVPSKSPDPIFLIIISKLTPLPTLYQVVPKPLDNFFSSSNLGFSELNVPMALASFGSTLGVSDTILTKVPLVPDQTVHDNII